MPAGGESESHCCRGWLGVSCGQSRAGSLPQRRPGAPPQEELSHGQTRSPGWLPPLIQAELGRRGPPVSSGGLLFCLPPAGRGGSRLPELEGSPTAEGGDRAADQLGASSGWMSLPWKGKPGADSKHPVRHPRPSSVPWWCWLCLGSVSLLFDGRTRQWTSW